MNLSKVVKLKSNYYGKIAAECKIAFETSGTIIDKILVPDFKNKKYTLKNKTWRGGLGKGLSQKDTTSIILDENGFKNTVNIYSSNSFFYG